MNAGAFRRTVRHEWRQECNRIYVDGVIATRGRSKRCVIANAMGSAGDIPYLGVRVSWNRPRSQVNTRATVGCEALITSSWGMWIVDVVWCTYTLSAHLTHYDV